MGTLAVGSVLFGIILGKFFRWPVLVPAFGVAIILVLIYPGHTERTFLVLFLQIALFAASLQIGYVIGMLALKRDRAPKLPKHFGSRTPDGTPVA